MNTRTIRRLAASGITASLVGLALAGVTAFSAPAAQAGTGDSVPSIGASQEALVAPGFTYEGPTDYFGTPIFRGSPGVDFTYTIRVQGNPTPDVQVITPTFDYFGLGALGLPDGLELTAGTEPGTVVISGTPTAEGLFIFRLQATNVAGQSTTDDLFFLTQAEGSGDFRPGEEPPAPPYDGR